MVRNQYNRTIHESSVTCPNPRCREQNAPEDSDDYRPRCWNCSTHLNGTPVSYNDVLDLEIIDIHSNGCGLGRTEDGFIILIDGVLPPATVHARITKVRDNFAYAEELERLELELEPEEDAEDEDEDNSETVLGSRENFWGSE